MDSLFERARKGNYPYFYITIFIITHILVVSLLSLESALLIALAVLLSFIGGDIIRVLVSINDKLEKKEFTNRDES